MISNIKEFVVKRVRQIETMDSGVLSAEEHRLALKGLARLNRMGRVASHLWRWIHPWIESGRPLRVLEIACGDGSLGLAVEQRARKAGLEVHWHGLDCNEVAIAMAQSSVANTDSKAVFVQGTAPQDVTGSYDVVFCNYFLHHLDREEAVELLGRMREVAQRGLVFDLTRSCMSMALAWAFTQVCTRSSVVRKDVVTSVRAAWTPQELVSMARDAGIDNPRWKRHYPVGQHLAWGDI